MEFNLEVGDELLQYKVEGADDDTIIRLSASLLGTTYYLSFIKRECFWLSYYCASTNMIFEVYLNEPLRNSVYNRIMEGLLRLTDDPDDWQTFKQALDDHRREQDELKELIKVRDRLIQSEESTET